MHLRLIFFGLSAVLLASCGGTEAHPVVLDESKKAVSVEIADFEISSDGVDRFTSCPPAGELGQGWMPKIPEWSPPSSHGDSGVTTTTASTIPDPTATPGDGTQRGRSITERAIEDTRGSFRTCYHRGLVFDPTQNGHVAIVVRVGADGRTAKTESYAACELAKETVTCMRDAAKALRFAPPQDGSETIVIPVVFAPRSGMPTHGSVSDTYTAAAYVALEESRPAFHECLDDARKQGHGLDAWGHFDLSVDALGHVQSANVDPWGGDQDLLSCAATVIQTVKFPAADAGQGKVLVRLRFNPRGGQ